MGTNIYGIGVSGLNAAQAGLLTTSHNIANASTPGFHRQQVVQTTAIAEATGGGFIGQGTQIATVRRLYNDFLANQTLQSQTQSSALAADYAQMQQIDNLLGDSTTGLSPTLQAFFSGVQDVSANPSSAGAPSVMWRTWAGWFSVFCICGEGLSISICAIITTAGGAPGCSAPFVCL